MFMKMIMIMENIENNVMNQSGAHNENI